MLRGAIIGLGNVALNGHLPAWRSNPDFQIVTGIDSSPVQRAAFQKLMPECACVPSLGECGEMNLDFVDICTPPFTHFSLIRTALERNLNVLCEKPLVLSEKDLGVIEESSGKSGKVLCTVHNWKYAPLCMKISELIRENMIGEIKHCAWYVLRDGPARTAVEDRENWRLKPEMSGGGILVDHGWHAFYLVLHWLGQNPKSVLSTLENRQYEDLPVEDTVKVNIEFEGTKGIPCTAEIFLTWASRIRRNWGVIEGTNGSIQIEDDFLRVSVKNGSTDCSVSKYSFAAPLSQGSHHPEWFQYVISEFFQECRITERRGENLKVAKSCLALIEHAKVSHNKGTRVNFL